MAIKTWMLEPASEKQLDFINRLVQDRHGHPDEDKLKDEVYLEELSKGDAARIIDELLKIKPVKVETLERSEESHIRAELLPKKGTFTVVFDSGDRRTLRFKTPDHGHFQDRVVISYLGGPNNETDYTGFANVDGDWVHLWLKFDGDSLTVKALKGLASEREEQEKAGMAYAIESGRCYRCGRTLTVPASIHRGLGPDCAGM